MGLPGKTTHKFRGLTLTKKIIPNHLRTRHLLLGSALRGTQPAKVGTSVYEVWSGLIWVQVQWIFT